MPAADLPAEEPPACSLAIALQPFSLLRARRPLYEAVLRLEASNISVVERALRGPDIALTPDTCLCIWDGHASQVDLFRAVSLIRQLLHSCYGIDHPFLKDEVDASV